MARGVHRASPICTVQYAILAERSTGISLCDMKAILHEVTHSYLHATTTIKVRVDERGLFRVAANPNPLSIRVRVRFEGPDS